MKSIPILSTLWNALTVPTLPPCALSINETHLVLLSLRYRQKELEPRQAGIIPIPAGLVRADFTTLNISDESRMLDALSRVQAQADIGRMGALSVSLPPGSAKSFVITLDSPPASKSELTQLIEWKIERAAGFRLDEMRISYSPLGRQVGRENMPQWMVSVINQNVIAQYESLFERLQWRVGMIVPQHLGEAALLMRSGLVDDQLAVSVNPRGLEVVILRGDAPVLIREVECDPADVDNEFYRLLIFYRDRLLPESGGTEIGRIMTVGSISDQQRFRELASTALERQLISLTPLQLGLRLDPGLPFQQVAAAAGLSSMAWS